MKHFNQISNRFFPLGYLSLDMLISMQLKIIFLFCIANTVNAYAQDVSFKEAFNVAGKQDVLAISVAQGDTLVFEPGDYFTSGRNLVISAQKVRISGIVKLGFYSPSDRPGQVPGVAASGKSGNTGGTCGHDGCKGAEGEPGSIGAPGIKGAPGAAIFINVGSLSGDGVLMLVSAGQIGGKGQKGGRGGTGGHGGDGLDRSCGGAFGLDTRRGPGNGGNGGRGGNGGSGGQGGEGGDGGVITVSSTLGDDFDKGLIRFDITPADGGSGGEGGDEGDKGTFGSMGGGSTCGGGGSNGSDGVPGNHGNVGDEGRKGSIGTIRYLRSDGSLVSASTCTLSEIASCPALLQNN